MVWRMPGLMTRMGGFFRRYRQRFARVVLLVGVVLAGERLAPHFARDTDVVLRLGPEHARVVRLELSYEHAGSEERHSDLRYPGGAPPEVRLAVSLPTGNHQLRARLEHRDGHAELVTRRFHTPADGDLHLDLSP
jgi:hypothetical protein